MRYFLLALGLILVLGSCKGKKTSLKGDEEVAVSEFIEFFPEVQLPFEVADTLLKKKESNTDSMLIAYAVFTQFVPDSVLTKEFGKNKPNVYPLGRSEEKGKEIYLFAKAVSGNKRVGYLLCFNRNNEFLNAMPLVSTGFNNYRHAYGSLDRKYQITTYRDRIINNETSYKKNVYFFNSASNEFSLILTEPNQDIIENIINPIDTLPQKAPHAGDYVKDDKNFISFRDGKNSGEMQFFVHFERDKGECIGELKGVAKMVSEDKAQYKEVGNPCTLEFSFVKNRVEMTEVEGCGSYRDIKCFFEGTFSKKTDEKAKTAKKKK